MPRLFVNEREIPSAPPGFSSLDEILKHVEDTHLPPHTVIRQIHVDGLPVALADPEDDTRRLLGDISQREKIEIITSTIWEVALDSIREGSAYLDRVAAVIPSLASSFQISPGPEAFENLRQLYEGFYFLNLLLDRLQRSFQISLSEILVNGVAVREHHERFISILKQLVDAQEREDFVLVSDLLEYEIIIFIPVWKEMLAVIAEKVTAAQ